MAASEDKQLSVLDVYNLLFAGKTLQMYFADDKEANNFRTSLYRIKRHQEDQMLAVDLMTESDIQAVSFKVQKSLFDGEPLTVTLSLAERSTIKKYGVTILNDSDED